MDEYAVEVRRAEQLELILHVGDHALSGIVRPPLAVVAPFGGRVTADSTGDDHMVAGDLLQGQRQFAQRIAIAPGTVELVDTQFHGAVDESYGFLVGDRTEVVAEALGAERNDWYVQSGTA